MSFRSGLLASAAITGALAHYSAFAADSNKPTPSSSFNPRISLILDGAFADYGTKAEPEVAGILLGPETEPRSSGFALGESELILEANIDDAYRGWATIAFENEGGETHVGLEEAYINTLALGNGLNVKAGRFFSDIGYLNKVHAHAWDFTDQALPYRALLATNYNDDGVQLKWVAPTDLFVELGAEIGRGGDFPGGGESRSGVHAGTVFARFGGDVGLENSYRIGAWALQSDADERETGEEDAPEKFLFTGDSRLYGLDFVYKWARNGNPANQNLVLQAEYIFREEDGQLDAVGVGDLDGDGVDDDISTRYDGETSGFYAQGVWQFVPRWRVGLRYDRLESDNVIGANPLGQYDLLTDTTDPQRTSLMLDYSRSEFSRIRVQYSRDETRPGGVADDQFFVQYIYSLGSHPAHAF